MRIKLGLLSTIIALCYGHVYSSEVQNVTEKTQEVKYEVDKEVNECRDHLNTAISMIEEFSALNIAFLKTLQESYFQGIDDVLNTHIETSKTILQLGNQLLEIDKGIVEIYEKYKADNSNKLQGMADELRNKLTDIAKSVKALGATFETYRAKIPVSEEKLRENVIELRKRQLYIDTEIMKIDHMVEMIKLDMNLERWNKMARDLNVNVPSVDVPIDIVENEEESKQFDKDLKEFEKKLLNSKHRRAHSSKKTRPHSADAVNLLQKEDSQTLEAKKAKRRKRRPHNATSLDEDLMNKEEN